MARTFPLIGVWAETAQGVSRVWSTASLPGAREAARAHAVSLLAHGLAITASVRAFALAAPEAAARGEDDPSKVLEILDFRDLPGYVEPEDA